MDGPDRRDGLSTLCRQETLAHVVEQVTSTRASAPISALICESSAVLCTSCSAALVALLEAVVES